VDSGNFQVKNQYRSPVSRHFITQVKQNTYAREINTVIAPIVNFQADVAAINAGEAEYFIDNNGATNFRINNRIYGVHQDTYTLYPISGIGLYQLDRGAFKALGVYNKFGDTTETRKILDKMGASPEQRQAALIAWQTTQGE